MTLKQEIPQDESAINGQSEVMPPSLALYRLVTGYYISRAIYVAARLQIADLLGQGARDCEHLASATQTHAPSLRRILRLLASAGVFTEQDDGKFALAPMGACLQTNVPGSMHKPTLLFAGLTQDSWRDLLYTVQTGKPAFPRVFGKGPFAYLAEHPEDAINFDAAMAALAEKVGIAVQAAYDFSQFKTVVDVGGGNGTLLAALLKANLQLTAVLFDQPHVINRAQKQMDSLNLKDRCSFASGDFFERVPEGGDVYILKHVVHDWNDELSLAILKTCHRSMLPGAKLLLIESIYPARIQRSDASLGVASNDVNMMVVTGGSERSEKEFASLYALAGFRLTRIIQTSERPCIIEGIRE